MRKIYYNLEIGYCGCNEEGITAVPDDWSDDKIDAMVDDMAQEYASGWEGDERLGFGNEDEDQEEITQSFYDGVGGDWRDATEEDE